jgi:hypothetical protein
MGEEGDARAGGRGHVCVRVRGLSEDASSLISPAGSLTMRQDDFSPVVKKCARVGGGARKRNVLREAQASAGYQTGEPEEREYHHRGRVSTHREDNVEYKYVSNAQPSTRTEPIAVAAAFAFLSASILLSMCSITPITSLVAMIGTSMIGSLSSPNPLTA